MFNRLRRRPSPATAIAGIALFVALSGTAAAQSGFIVDSPDDLAPNVVTGQKIVSNEVTGSDIRSETITDIDLKDPQLKIRALSGGGTLSGSDGTVTRVATGTYDVTFSASALNAANPGGTDTLLNNNCAFTATSRNELAMMEIGGPSILTPNTVRVRASFPQNFSGGVLMSASDSAFDILASC
jgi:hypothetical protein